MNKFISIFTALCLAFVLIGCTKEPADETPKKTHLVTAEATLDQILTQEERQTYTDFIYSLKFGAPASSVFCYNAAPEAHAKLYSVSLKGLPVIMYEVAFHNLYVDDKNPYNPLDGLPTFSHFRDGMASMLRANEATFYRAVGSDEELDENSFGSSLYYFISDAETFCPQIISTNLPTYEKIKMLRNFGILAIPYVVDAIDRGEYLYKAYFTEIGLHLTTEEFHNIVCTYNSNECVDDKYNEIQLHPKAEDFDYKVWLSENEEDLDNLFKFLDAYCAEYESENKS